MSADRKRLSEMTTAEVHALSMAELCALIDAAKADIMAAARPSECCLVVSLTEDELRKLAGCLADGADDRRVAADPVLSSMLVKMAEGIDSARRAS